MRFARKVRKGKLDIRRHGMHVELPRALVGGVKKRPTLELLYGITEDYAQLELENRQLREAIRLSEPAADADDFQRVLQPSEPRVETAPARPESHDESGEFVLAVFDAALRAARLARASTRHEAEGLIYSMRSQARALERDLERARPSVTADLEELEALRHTLREHIQLPPHLLGALAADIIAEGMPTAERHARHQKALKRPSPDGATRKSKKSKS
jgi:hypothetical protein